MDYRKIGFWQLVLLTFLLNFVIQAVHEGGHWIVLETCGYGPDWGFTQLIQWWEIPGPTHPADWISLVSPTGEKYWLHLISSPGKTAYSIMLFAGPFVSCLAGLLGLCIAVKSSKQAARQIGLVFALIASLMMSQYYLRGFHRMGGDEYFLAANLGIPKYLIDIPFGIAFITLFIIAIKSLGDWKTILKWLGAIIIGSLPAGLFLMVANSIVLKETDLQNPFFRPVLGWSFPVIAVYLLICLSLWIWWKQANKSKTID